MKNLIQVSQVSLASACGIFLLSTISAHAQYDIAPAKLPAQLVQPSADIQMSKEYAKTVAEMAYVWGWPLMNQKNRRMTLTKAPQPSLLNGTLPAAPMSQLSMLHDYIRPEQRFVACPNQDVVYGLGYMALDKEAVVVQVPDFGDRFWVYAMYDARTDQFSKLGKQYSTKAGFYLVVGPNWKDKIPSGITGVIHSPTEFGMVIPRIFQDDTAEDKNAIQPFINQIVMYPASQFDGKIKTIDWSQAPSISGPKSSGGETKWVVPEKFFDELAEILKSVPPLPGEEALYATFNSLLTAAAKDPTIKKTIVQAAIDTDKAVIKNFLEWKYNGTPVGNNWNRSTNNAIWGVDYFNRTATARSNIYENNLNETRYYYTDYDAKNIRLDGNNLYEIHFAPGQEPPVNGFWSLTLYDKDHFFYANKLNRYSLGTKNKSLVRNDDGSLTLYAGARSPGKGKEANWLPAPKGKFSLYIRAYWGKKEILDGSWQPPVVRKVQQTEIKTAGDF